MKQRMYNTFVRIFKNETLAVVLSNVGYFLLYCYYMVIRIFIKNSKCYRDYDTEIESIKEELFGNINSKKNSGEIKRAEVDKNIDLSIIMPAYNVEKYISQSISSVLKQKTKYAYELIIINDGATDNTEEIIKKFNDTRIKYIKQDNQGLSGARNTGMEVAVGRYITFIDSDDVLADNAIDTMVDAIRDNNADIVVGSYYMFFDGSDKKQICINDRQIMENNPQKAICNHGYAWGKVFDRKIFDRLEFPVQRWFEDTLICTVVFRMQNKKIVVLDDVVYGYRINSNGISRTARSSVKALDHYWVFEDAINQAHINGITDDEVLYHLAINHLSTLLYRRVSLLDEDKIKKVFILSCDLINKLSSSKYEKENRIISRDIEKSFETYNYKLWKLGSFIV